MRSFSVVGLGKLGASMAAAIASRGFPVMGVDVDERAVKRFNQGHAPVHETGLDELIAANRERLCATTSHAEAVAASELTFVVVPTPSDEDGGFSIDYAADAFAEIGRALMRKDAYHTVVLTSTVLPGSTRFGLLPILEAESGKTCGEDFGLCYSPEFIALGSVIRDFLNPDFLLIGESDARAGDQLESCYREIVVNDAPCKRMSFENAELAKIAVNAYVTMKITFANMLAELCERIPEGDVEVVTDAIGVDRRIGRAYLTGGLGFGGPCFPRDNLALASFAHLVGADVGLCQATGALNERFTVGFVDRFEAILPAAARLGVLGLAYKPFSNVVEESPAIAIARAFARRGFAVLGYDPLAGDAARAELGDDIRVVDSLQDCLAVDVLVVATPDPAFKALNPQMLERHGVKIIIDCWRMLDDEFDQSPTLRYVPLGRSFRDGDAIARLSERWARMSSQGALEPAR